VLSLGDRAHVAAAFASGNLAIFVNGTGVASKVSSGASVFASGNSPVTTSAEASGLQRYNGLLDELSFYNRVLTSNEVTAIWPTAAGAGGGRRSFTSWT
jgi:hypothetical protein